MNLTDFFKNCAEALKKVVLKEPSSDSNQHVSLKRKATDAEAIELFAEIRSMEFSHKSERGDGAACDLRAHAIYEIFEERGFEVTGKGWISSPPAPNSTNPNFLIKPPVEVLYRARTEDYGENGRNRIKDNKPFNIHAALIVPTVEGRELAFDTYFYETPPELDQWLEDFKPYEDGVELKFQIANPDYVHFYEIGSRLPEEGTWSLMFHRSRAHSRVQSELRHLDSNPVDTPLKAKWIEQRSNRPGLNEDAGPEPNL